ncbi:hypothetical protein WR25_17155 [Diploscapter pachys]|uniref:Uncharacterized protein n=1 Tax=Diploscapter pachys TaxID=2018661 RepID=A0A2A2JGP6_9BILA|nr:hypothetical protein WR25_17155 [Diploscapter pachys]
MSNETETAEESRHEAELQKEQKQDQTEDVNVQTDIEIAVRRGDSSETHNSNEQEAELSYLKDVAMGKATELEQFIEENDKIRLDIDHIREQTAFVRDSRTALLNRAAAHFDQQNPTSTV